MQTMESQTKRAKGLHLCQRHAQPPVAIALLIKVAAVLQHAKVSGPR